MASIFGTKGDLSNKSTEAGGKLSGIFFLLIEPSPATQKTGVLK
jgi:hypothetical protein